MDGVMTQHETADVPAVTLTHKRRLAGAFFTLLLETASGWTVEVVLWVLSALVAVVTGRERRATDRD